VCKKQNRRTAHFSISLYLNVFFPLYLSLYSDVNPLCRIYSHISKEILRLVKSSSTEQKNIFLKRKWAYYFQINIYWSYSTWLQARWVREVYLYLCNWKLKYTVWITVFFGLRPSSRILKNPTFRKLDLVTEVRPFYQTQQSRCFSPPYLKTEAGPVSETLCSLEYRTTDKVKNASNSDCYAPLSEPFRIYLKYTV
jgi:hypothetical protein